MSANTTIEWATKSWNPVRGCSRVSPGCDNCYAMNFAHRFSGAGKPYEGLTTIRKGKVDWSGTARFIPGALDEPLRWKKPERVFVNSMSDLFHHSLTDAEILRVWMVMARCPQHEFLVLTKRPERALQWLTRWADVGRADADVHLARGPAEVREKHTEGRALMWAEVLDGMGEPPPGAAFPTYDWQGGIRWWPVELPNVWLGVSVEDQATADKRIPLLLQCPAAVHWVSYEPALGPVDFSRYLDIGGACECQNPAPQRERCEGKGSKGWIRCNMGMRRLRWIVCGGESGPSARPFNVNWARDVVEQCRNAPGWGKTKNPCPVFVKQFGSKPSTSRSDVLATTDPNTWLKLKDRKGGDLSEIPGNWPREFPTPRTGAAAE